MATQTKTGRFDHVKRQKLNWTANDKELRITRWPRNYDPRTNPTRKAYSKNKKNFVLVPFEYTNC